MFLNIEKIKDVKTPTGNKEDAGYDFYIPNDFETTILKPHEDILISSGIKVDIPKGFALIAYNKSGISTKQKLVLGACVIDSSYIGEIFIHVYNFSNENIVIKKNQKIVQFILIPYIKPEIKIIDEIKKKTIRGNNGFGSTGI